MSTSNGQVNYRLLYPDTSGRVYGLMLVEMQSSIQIRVEMFVGATSATAPFDAGARVFVR